MLYILQSWCHYTFYNEEQRHYTDEKMGAVPKYNYEKLHTVKEVGSEVICIVFQIYIGNEINPLLHRCSF